MVADLPINEILMDAAASDAGDPRHAILAAPMSGAQKIGIALTLLITAVDGFDILAASFAAPGMIAAWHLTHATIGLILGINLIGIGLGALFISPLADRVGRRLTILPCLLLLAAAMFMSGVANGTPMLAALRLISGVAIGGLVGATLSLATEYANARNRPLAAAVISIGLPLGGVAGGIIAALLLKTHGWASLFVAGGCMTVAVAGAAAVWLPESVDFLIGRGDARSLQTLNLVLGRFGHAPVTVLPVARPGPGRAAGGGRAGIFAPGQRGTTLVMVIINFAQMMPVFYFISWLPQMVADMKFSGSAAAGVSIFQNLFGIIGALTMGWLARKWPVVPLAVVTMAGTAGAILLFAFLPPSMALLRGGAAVEGFMALGSSAAIYGLMARAFPAATRSTGTGFAYAFGRLGSIVAVVVPGFLFTHGLGLKSVTGLMACGSFVAIGAILLWNAKGGAKPWTARVADMQGDAGKA